MTGTIHIDIDGSKTEQGSRCGIYCEQEKLLETISLKKTFSSILIVDEHYSLWTHHDEFTQG